jgi:hypothetical protein
MNVTFNFCRQALLLTVLGGWSVMTSSSCLQVPNEAAIKPLGGLPNAQFPSDHVPLVFGFRFKKSEAFTSMLPFDQPAGAGRSTDDGAPAGDHVSALAVGNCWSAVCSKCGVP